jgi:hypothetical protein
MAEIISPQACPCGLPYSVFTALEASGFEMMGRATKMCTAKHGLCCVRRAVLRSMFYD